MKALNIDKSLLIKNAGEKSVREWAEFYGCKIRTVRRWVKVLKLTPKKGVPPPVSKETREKIKNGIKIFRQNNPNRRGWLNVKKKSVPCENVKNFLREQNIAFVEEFDPQVIGRNFSIDIAIPDKMIAIEVNGNQHYNASGELTPYYQERHNLIEKMGWNIFEIHYSCCFNFKKWIGFLDTLKTSRIIKPFDYFSYTPRKTKKQLREQHTKKRQAIPSAETLLEESKLYTLREMGEKYNVSFVTISKWYKRKGITPIKHNKHRSPKILSPLCPNCGESKVNHAKLCMKCSLEKKRKFEWPTKEQLKEMIDNKSFSEIGRIYNVSDNAIRHVARHYGLIGGSSKT